MILLNDTIYNDVLIILTGFVLRFPNEFVITFLLIFKYLFRHLISIRTIFLLREMRPEMEFCYVIWIEERDERAS